MTQKKKMDQEKLVGMDSWLIKVKEPMKSSSVFGRSKIGLLAIFWVISKRLLGSWNQRKPGSPNRWSFDAAFVNRFGSCFIFFNLFTQRALSHSLYKPFWLPVANKYFVPFQTQPSWFLVANGLKKPFHTKLLVFYLQSSIKLVFLNLFSPVLKCFVHF